jgi:adenosylcobinamide-GDP ribazoletransferase
VSFLRHYLIALRFFTRVPVTGTLAQRAGFTPDMLRASAAHFPGIGWLVGIVGCVAFALLGLALPEGDFTPFAAAVGSTIATVLLTGGNHAADGLGSGAEPERALEILRDSRLGAFGAMALALALLTKVSLLALLAARSPVAVLAALVAAHVLSRFWSLLLACSMPRMGSDGGFDSGPLAERLGSTGLAIAAAWCVLAMVIAGFAQGMAFVVAGLVASALALAWLRRMLARGLKGLTGHALGAAQQVCEIAFYLGAAVALAMT